MRAQVIISAVIGVCAAATPATEPSRRRGSSTRPTPRKNVSRSIPEEATRRVVAEKFNEAHAKAQTPDQQRVVAADFYLGFSMLHAHAMLAYCKEFNPDPTGFA